MQFRAAYRNLIYLWASIIAFNSHRLFHTAVVIEQIQLSIHFANGVMIVSIQTKEFSLIWKQFSAVGIWSERIRSSHILNCAAGHTVCISSSFPIGTIGIVIGVSNFVDARIFE